MRIHFPGKTSLLIIVGKPFNTSTSEGRALERRRRITLTALTSIVSKVLTMSIPLLTLKLTYDYLGIEVYGLWSAVTTFFALFAFSDLGLGNGLQTKLSQANGKEDIYLCRKIISNTYIILLAVSSVFLVVFLVVFKYVDWAKLMNAQDAETIGLAASVVFIIVMPKILSIPVAIIQRTQFALQEGYINNIWNIAGALLSLLSVLVIVCLNFGKLVLLSISALIPLFIAGINMLAFFRFRRKDLRISIKLFDFSFLKSLFSLGFFFCILSILISIGMAMDTFIVARTCSLSEAASFSIIYKIAAILYAVVTIFSTPLWGANGEAIARGEIGWVKQNTKRISMLLAGMTLILSIIVLLFAKFIFKIWLGDGFVFSFTLLFWMCVLQILQSFISPYFMVLNAFGIVKKQILLFAIYTPISFVLKYILSQTYGVGVIPMIGAIGYFTIIVLGTYFFSIKQFNNAELKR